MKYTQNYKSTRFAPGKEFVNYNGVKATILGKTLAKYSRVFVLLFEDGLIGTTNYSGLTELNFKHPIIFSEGNNTTNKYKTIFKRFEQIISRCNNETSKDYYRYGGNGISCKFANIYSFYFELLKDSRFTDMLNNPSSFEIDRIDNLGNYESGNIRIATRRENQRNKCNNFVYKLIDNYTEEILYTGIKTDCEFWIAKNLKVKTSIDWRNPKYKIGRRNGFSVRHELL